MNMDVIEEIIVEKCIQDSYSVGAHIVDMWPIKIRNSHFKFGLD